MLRLWLVFALLFAAAPARAQDRLKVMVSIPPLAYFTEKICGEKAHVSVMVPPAANPHVYEPTPGQLRELSAARVYVKAGSGLEFELAWMDKLRQINRTMLVCDSSEGVELIDVDPHIWTSPRNAMVIAANIRDCLAEVDPQNKEFYTANTQVLIKELEDLGAEIGRQLESLTNRKFFIYHPAWGYFGRDFGLEEIAVEQLGKEPAPRQLAELVDKARAEGVKTVLVAPQFSERSARVIAGEIGGTVARVDALSEDYPRSLREMARALKGSQ